MALHALARFGAPLRGGRVWSAARRRWPDNSAALVRIMGREAAMAPRYVQAMREMVAGAAGRRGVRGTAEQDGVAGQRWNASRQ